MIKNNQRIKAVMAVAGSDPSGGAGIQADLKTYNTLGVYGCAAITCLTVQNTTGVKSYQPVDPNLVKKQMEAVLEDIEVTHIKIGMVGTDSIAQAIGSALSGFSGEVIYDPVLSSSAGQNLIDTTKLNILCEEVVNRVTVLIPNLPELEIISAKKCESTEKIASAAGGLLDKYPHLRSVIVKGGHVDVDKKEVEDVLIQRSDKPQQTPYTLHPETHPRIQTSNSHGTGCTFASAFTAFHMKTGNDVLAFKKTTGFLDQLLTKSAAYHIGHGNGPLLHHLI